MIASESSSTRVATITFVEGKTLKSTGPYTLHVTVPIDIATEVQTLITTRLLKKARYLFCAAGKAMVSKELKALGLEMRSTRRGALQTLAAAGLPPQEILLFSRHKDIHGLYAYLDDGKMARWEAAKTLPASCLLQQQTSFPWGHQQ